MFIENEGPMFNKSEFQAYLKLKDAQLKKLADELDDGFAQFVYGWKKMAESNGAKDSYYAVGMSYMEHSAENGCPDAENWLANHLLDHHSHKGLPSLRQKGIMLLSSAALKGHFEAAVGVGYLHFCETEMHNPKKATALWGHTVVKGQETFEEQSTLYFLGTLSMLFSKGAYATQKRFDLAGPLHLLSFSKYVTPEMQRNITIILSDIALDRADLFQKLKSKGLVWPEAPQDLRSLVRDETFHSPEITKEVQKVRRHRIEICNSLRSLMVHDTAIRQEMTDYLKPQLPPEIISIPNLVFHS
jgi:hypothetical protein